MQGSLSPFAKIGFGPSPIKGILSPRSKLSFGDRSRKLRLILSNSPQSKTEKIRKQKNKFLANFMDMIKF